MTTDYSTNLDVVVHVVEVEVDGYTTDYSTNLEVVVHVVEVEVDNYRLLD